MSKLVHLIYIHGFQGNDTTFQSFPLDLQNHLSIRVPPHLDVKIQSSLYPTYKSVKPLSHAAKNFLEWLQTQPPGPVILLGHSMGGLLAAEAATDTSNILDEVTGRPRRIVGVIAFDTPYLGMHPHVVISGIASLFPKEGEGKGSEGEMNVHPDITVVPDQVTDDWEGFKRETGIRPEVASSQTDGSSSNNSSRLSRGTPPPLLDRALDFATAKSENPFIRWVMKHSNDPLAAGKRWIVEHLQFGGAMFDPSGLKERYIRLVNWRQGMWTNYWTQTVPKRPDGTRLQDGGEEQRNEQLVDNDHALVESGIVKAPGGEQSSIEREWMRETAKLDRSGERGKKVKEKIQGGRHFIVLPTGLGRGLGGGEKWEKVIIAGVDDEVAAHCGLFIRGQNLDYEGLLGRVGKRVIEYCEHLSA